MLGGASAPLPWPYEVGGHRTMTTDDNPSLSAQQQQNGHRGGHYSRKEDNIIRGSVYVCYSNLLYCGGWGEGDIIKINFLSSFPFKPTVLLAC